MAAFSKFKKKVNPAYVRASTYSTLISACACSIGNAVQEISEVNTSIIISIAFIIFCASISIVLSQLLIAVCICNETLENMNAYNSCILAPSCADQVQSELTSLLKDLTEDVYKITIICYGTSGYNNTLNQVHDGVINRKIKFDVMVCSPDTVYQNSPSDKEKINNIVEELNSDSRFNFYFSKYLPTIRACVVYDKKNQPIWNCVQTYCYTQNSISSAQYELSYAIVGRKDNSYVLNNNTKIIEKEFKRLQKTKVAKPQTVKNSS